MAEVTKSSTKSATTKSSGKKTWLWGMIGVASVAALGFAITKLKPVKTKSSKKKSDLFLSEWKFIERIDRALVQANIEGIEIYLKGNQILLVASSESKSNLPKAIELVSKLEGIGTVSGLVQDDTNPSDDALDSHYNDLTHK